MNTLNKKHPTRSAFFLVLFCLVFLTASCRDGNSDAARAAAYQEGYEAGFEEGYKKGNTAGVAQGYQRGKSDCE